MEYEPLNKTNVVEDKLHSYPIKNIGTLANMKHHPYLMDTITEHLPFGLYHYSTLFVCIFSMICDGYLSAYLRMSDNMVMAAYSWTQQQYYILLLMQMIFSSLGALISTNSRTGFWDVYSNFWIAVVGALCLIMINIYTEALFFGVLIILFSLCHGLIANICTNFLLELFNLKLRDSSFLFVSSMRIIGNVLFGAFVCAFFDKKHTSPETHLIGLICAQILLSASLLYLAESPRVLFVNNDMIHVYESIQDAFKVETKSIQNQKFKDQMIEILSSSREEMESAYEPQQINGVFETFGDLWGKVHLQLTIKAIIFTILSSAFITSLKEDYFFLVNTYQPNDQSKYLFTLSPNTSFNHAYMVVYYAIMFSVILCLICLFYFAPKIKRIYFTTFSIGICTVALLLMLIVRNHFVYYTFVFETLSFFYLIITYLHLSAYTTTKLRNSITSVIFISAAATNYFTGLIVDQIASDSPLAVIWLNLLIAVSLFLMEFFYVGEDEKNKMLQEIEVSILNKNKKIH